MSLGASEDAKAVCQDFLEKGTKIFCAYLLFTYKNRDAFIKHFDISSILLQNINIIIQLSFELSLCHKPENYILSCIYF